ncbi:MAG: hypothetical protein ACRENI_02835 [Gemmatimonadaceae bacterium]
MPLLAPMYTTTGTHVPDSTDWMFEPRYDGIRILAYIDADSVAFVTRNGKDKTNQFPEIVSDLVGLVGRRWRERTKSRFVIDGEIVALSRGAPARFQELQSRMSDCVRSSAGDRPSQQCREPTSPPTG